MIVIFFLLCLMLFIFSYAFVDPNMYLFSNPSLSLWQKNLSFYVFSHRPGSMIFYIILIFCLFVIYIFLLNKIKINNKKTLLLLLAGLILLLFSYPAFSYDIFNYIATGKIAFFYHENPYVLMPIEIPNEPMLSFLHAANKTALYGPFWIFLTALPHLFGFNNLFFSIFSFKIMLSIFYLLTLKLIYQLSLKSMPTVIFFALNPLVVIETLVSGHNDIVMMFFALASFSLLKNKKILISIVILILSILIKYATLFLLPVYIFAVLRTLKKEAINWEKIWFWSGISMFTIFCLSPLREEMYPWYFIWVLPFIALLKDKPLIKSLAIALSLGLSLRFAPYILYWSWEKVGAYKFVLTILPIIFYLILFFLKYIKIKYQTKNL